MNSLKISIFIFKIGILKNFILFFLLSFIAQLCAQTPAHFILGENELDGLHIYALHQDSSLNYWIGTDNGLYKYDGYEFKNIRYSEMLSPSLFSIRSDHKGAIYFHNLSGQIFKIENDTCSLYFVVPDSLLSSIFEIGIDRDNRVFVSTQSVFEITSEKTIKHYKAFPISSAIFYQLKDKRVRGIGVTAIDVVRGFTVERDSIHEIDYTIIRTSTNKIERISVFKLGEQPYIIECTTGAIYAIKQDSLIEISQLTNNKNIKNIYATLEHFWIPNTSLGLSSFDDIENPNIQQLQIFEDYKISAYIEDNEQNILFGTFKEGIIVIPKSQVSTINLGNLSGKINKITRNGNSELIFGTNDGTIGSININTNEISVFGNFHHSTIEFIEYLEHHDQFLVGGTDDILFDQHTKVSQNVRLGALKDITPIWHNQYILATNTRVFIYNPEGKIYNPFLSESVTIDEHDPHSKLFSGRCYATAFDSISASIYIGTSIGIKRLKSSGSEDLTLKGRTILSRDILFYHGRIYIATDKDGILVYENDTLIHHWTSLDKLESDHTRQLVTNDEYIFINTDRGIQIISESGETKWLINKSEGLITDHVIDMVATKNELFVLNQRGLQRIKLNQLRTSEFVPNIRFNGLKINERPTKPNNELNIFNHDQNKFSVDFGSISLKNRNEIRYNYRLLGVEIDWQENDYMDHKVDYKTLPPGEYTFEVKAIWRNRESETIQYRFLIKTPFWLKWWFFVLIFTIIFSILFAFFYRQMRSQRRKSKLQEELYESKLTAIQAQMNPHFIFNSLNSIQDLVLKNDAENAYIYISKFAMLVRTTLTHSDKDFIDFNDEVKSLTLYLTLEKLRFKSAFEFSITAPEDVEVQIPPMLIQPFIENSIVHGLLHKSGQKKLSVTFELADVIICKITDNGIGRKEAKLIQVRQFSTHESFAISAIKKRLVLLAFKLGGEYTVEYIDLEEDGIASGTQVIVRIPYVKDF